MSIKKSYILIASVIVVLGLIIVTNYFSYSDKDVYQYRDAKLVVGERNTIRGILLSSCTLENYDECIIRIDMKSGPDFSVCEWDYNRNFTDNERHPDCITIASPLNPEQISNEQLLEFKNFLNKEVEITGSFKSIKWGITGEDCQRVQIGCERDITVFNLESIKLINK